MTAIIKLIQLAIFLIILISCQKPKKFEELQTQNIIHNNLTTTNIEVTYCPTKGKEVDSLNALFLGIDFSGSNNSRSDNCFPGTDPVAARVTEIKNLLRSQVVNSKNKLYLAIAVFGTNGGSEVGCYRLFNNKTSSFIEYNAQTQEQIFQVLDQLALDAKNNTGTGFTPPDCKGWTNYLGGLKYLQSIKNEFMSTMRAQYPSDGDKEGIVFINYLFESDGIPKVPDTENPQATIIQKDNDIYSSVYDLVFSNNSVENTKIKDVFNFFSTAYYTKPYAPLNNGKNESQCPIPPDEKPEGRLQKMAKIGKGAFYPLSNLNYQDYRMGSLYNNYVTEKIIAYNRNGVWTTNNNTLSFMQDSDGDGLADALELAINSDPKNDDSDNDGIRDGFEYKFCGSVTCAHLDSYSMVGIEDSDGDGIRDIEEMLIGSDVHKSDMNGNRIPDFLDWVNGISLSSTNMSLDVDGDGISNIDELYINTPVNGNDPRLEKNKDWVNQIYKSKIANNGCLTTNIENFRTTDHKTPFKLNLSYYARQQQGELQQLITTEVEVKPGDKIKLAPEVFKKVYYESAK